MSKSFRDIPPLILVFLGFLFLWTVYQFACGVSENSGNFTEQEQEEVTDYERRSRLVNFFNLYVYRYTRALPRLCEKSWESGIKRLRNEVIKRTKEKGIELPDTVLRKFHSRVFVDLFVQQHSTLKRSVDVIAKHESINSEVEWKKQQKEIMAQLESELIQTAEETGMTVDEVCVKFVATPATQVQQLVFSNVFTRYAQMIAEEAGDIVAPGALQ